MFGYVNVNRKELSKEDQERLQQYYCGLSRQLKIEGGLTEVDSTSPFIWLYLSVTPEYGLPRAGAVGFSSSSGGVSVSGWVGSVVSVVVVVVTWPLLLTDVLLVMV